MEFMSRYEALGIPFPEPDTVCQGHCEGTGWIPIVGSVVRIRGSIYAEPETDPVLAALWKAQHEFTCSWHGRLRNILHGLVTFDRFRLRLGWDRCDGYHFVKCPDCGGAGKRK